MKLPPPPGTKITVFDSGRVELGEGTLRRYEFQADRLLTIYECEEHVILAKGDHYLKVDGIIHHIRTGPA